ncbi:MAG: putative membrane protein [Gammaproteobacteria bacterium]|jgi:uncharacterized membrane protein
MLGAIGLALTSGLLFFSLTRANLPYCGSGSSCDVVQSSRWSMFLGVPIVLWGWGVYFAITGIALIAKSNITRSRLILFFATLGFAVGLYLNAVSLWVIKAMCAYCLVSLAIVISIFVLSWRRAAQLELGTWRLGSSVIAGLLVLFMHLNYAGVFSPNAGPEDPYLRELAEHLTNAQAKFYGAYWCPHCQQQKLVFGSSASRLPYVECSPNGQKGPRATACLVQNIQNYPTWVVSGRRVERMLSAAQLASYSGFEPPPNVEEEN